MQVMLDLETLGVSPGCAIVAIGAVRFDREQVTDEFYYRPEWGGRLDHNTVRWWMGQSDAARAELLRDPDGPMERGLTEFMKFLGSSPVWGNGSDFDNVILASCYRRLSIPGWSHRQNRCYRTVRSLLDVPGSPPTIKHHALEDARAQAVHLMAILHQLGL